MGWPGQPRLCLCRRWAKLRKEAGGFEPQGQRCGQCTASARASWLEVPRTVWRMPREGETVQIALPTARRGPLRCDKETLICICGADRVVLPSDFRPAAGTAAGSRRERDAVVAPSRSIRICHASPLLAPQRVTIGYVCHARAHLADHLRSSEDGSDAATAVDWVQAHLTLPLGKAVYYRCLSQDALARGGSCA